MSEEKTTLMFSLVNMRTEKSRVHCLPFSRITLNLKFQIMFIARKLSIVI